jgi:hypothetical protein
LRSSELSKEDLPPEVLLDWEVGGLPKGNSLDHIIIFLNAFDSSPEIEHLIVVLLTELADCEF